MYIYKCTHVCAFQSEPLACRLPQRSAGHITIVIILGLRPFRPQYETAGNGLHLADEVSLNL